MSTQLASFFLLLVFATVVENVYSVDEVDETSSFDFTLDRTLSSLHHGVSPVYLPLRNQVKDPAAGVFTVIGGASVDQPCCVSWGIRRVDCFIRGGTSNVLHWWKENGKSQEEWEDLGGIIISGVECVSRSVGIIDVMVVGQNLALFVNTYTATSGKWTAWQSKGGRNMDVPSCVARTTSIIDCMVRDGTNRAFYISSVDGKWTSWVNRGGVLTWPSKTSRRSETATDFWHVGSNSNLYQGYLAVARWGPWKNLGARIRGQVEPVSVNPERIDVLAIGTKNQLMHLVWNKSWQKWVDLGGSLLDAPSCVAAGTIIHCFMVATDSYLYRRSYDGTDWTDWFCSYGAFFGRPSCVLSNENEVSCYMTGFNREIVEMVYKF